MVLTGFLQEPPLQQASFLSKPRKATDQLENRFSFSFLNAIALYYKVQTLDQFPPSPPSPHPCRLILLISCLQCSWKGL